MATAARNKDEIDKLAEKFSKLEEFSKKRKLPARAPPIYTYNDPDFRQFAKNVHNYLLTMAVDEADRVQVLLTFVCQKSYSLITRIYDVTKLREESYNEVVDKITGVVEQKISQTEATVKLLNVKQGTKDLQSFITDLERLGQQAFPQEALKKARESCMSASLISNINNKSLAFELYKFQHDNKDGRTFSELTLKALELETVTRARTDDQDSTEFAILNVSTQNNTQSQNTSKSDSHLIANCPNKPRQNNNNQYQMSYAQNHGNLGNYAKKLCYVCSSDSHLIANCPYNDNEYEMSYEYDCAQNEIENNYNRDRDNYNNYDLNDYNDQENEMCQEYNNINVVNVDVSEHDNSSKH